MSKGETCGEIIEGDSSKILIRQSSNSTIEIGDLLVEDREPGYIILQVFDLIYGSQLPRLVREMISGMKLEGFGTGLDLIEPQLRNYLLAMAKPILHFEVQARNPKILPNFFGYVRHINAEDLSFLTKPNNPIRFGKVRSGSKTLDVDVYLDAVEVFSHHILIPATTGKGKSNLVKTILWDALGKDYCGILVLDPHNEYYGKKNTKGLKDHPEASESLRYYSPNPPNGAFALVVHLASILPSHFRGIADFTEAQEEAMGVAYTQSREDWIENIFRPGTALPNVSPATVNVLQRKLDRILGLYYDEEDDALKFRFKTFSNSLGESTIKEITSALEDGKKVIVDTSTLSDQAELLIGSIITNHLLYLHKKAKEEETLESKPVVSIVIEEAPRVIGTEALSTHGSNIYSDIAREGRKFKIGLVAVTQLASVIPKTILANINTKIILGNELSSERAAIIDSASQDLSLDDRNIASLRKGEAIISSSFVEFAVPVALPLFDEIVKKTLEEGNFRKREVGVVA